MKTLLAFLLFCSCFTALVPAQQAQSAPDAPRAIVSDVKTVPGGGILLGIRVCAPAGKALDLALPPAHRGPGSSAPANGDPRPFTLDGSTLRDLATNQTYRNLPLLPDNPFLGPMEVLTGIRPGGWVQLGVAFPPLPPPQIKEGKKQPYQLLFEIPGLKTQTVLKLDPDTLRPL